MNVNLIAFLDMIAFSEGTAHIGDNGYNALVGGGTFIGYNDHPRIKVFLPRLNIYSTAAGRYQLLARYFNTYKSLLGLDDFSPDAQDKIAIQQIKECKALEEVKAGNFEHAVQLCAHIWASLPGAGYGQHEHKIDTLKTAYINAGGTLA